MENQNTSAHDRKLSEKRAEKQKRASEDSPLEKREMVMHGAKLKCPYAQAPGELKVTSNEIILQDKLFATHGDGNNMVNLQFKGTCGHPKWPARNMSPPPCMSVIKLSPWQNLGTSLIQEQTALVKESFINCDPEFNSAVAKPIPKIESISEKAKENIIDEVIKDIYINKIDASVFINFGKKDGDIRMITKGEWNSGNEEPDGEKNKYLIENSHVVTVDDAQIQEKLQEIHRLTNKTEQQIYIYLDRDSASIKAVLGEQGTDGEATISSEELILGKDGSGNAIYSKPIIRSGDIRGALLGQAHTHNLMHENNNNKTSASSTMGGEKTVNGFGTSEKDKNTSKSLDINIYALDSWNFSSKNAEVTIGRVTPSGKQKSSIGKTHGKGDGKKTVNIGLECLNLRVGR